MTAQALLLAGGLIAAILAGIPIFISVIVTIAIFAAVYPASLPLAIIGQTFVSGLDSYYFAAIPLFFLAGELMNAGGISARLLRFARALMGHWRGGLSHANIAANMVMAGVSGSAIADAAAIGSMMIPAMKKEGYGGAYAAAITAAAATIGPMIPPSIPLVLFALLTSTSTSALFLAGVVPGVLMGIFLLGASVVISRRRNYPRSAKATSSELLTATVHAGAAILMPVLVVAALVGGVATTTEVAALAAAYALFVSMVIHRELDVRGAVAALKRAATDSCVVLIIASVAGVFTWLIGSIGIAASLANWVQAVAPGATYALLLISLIVLIAGMLLEPIVILLVLTPVLFPVTQALTIDPVQFGIVMTLGTLIGLITPPVGFLIYLTGGIAQAPVRSVINELWPFITALLALLLAIILWPPLSLFLPRYFLS